MSELSSTTDGPPPPPAPPEDTASKPPTPDASPDLADGLPREGQDYAARMANAQEQATDVRQDLRDYHQEPIEVPDGSIVRPDVSPELASALPSESQDAGLRGADGGTLDDSARMANAQDQATNVRQDFRDYHQDNAAEGAPSDVS